MHKRTRLHSIITRALGTVIGLLVSGGLAHGNVPASHHRQEQVRVQGVVRNAEDNQPLHGVSLVSGQRTLSATGETGRFDVTVGKGTDLVFTLLGYETQTRRIDNAQEGIVVTLTPSSTEIEEVVVTALGIRREERALGYATTTVEGEKLTEALSSNWTDALSGKVPGLNLVRSNSGPTGSNKIILRGETNLTNSEDNSALIVVDGVVINHGSGRATGNSGEDAYGTSGDVMPADYGSGLNDINPEDIESVSVLRGPGAAALYGQRGANGAIIITTKSGRANRKGLGITVNSNASIEDINRWPDLQWEYGQGTAGRHYYSFGASEDGPSTSATSSAYGPRFDGQHFYQFDPVTQLQGTERTPWIAYPDKIKTYFDAGQTYTNSISVDGGTDRTTARFSATNVTNSWIVPNTGYNRNTASLAVNSKVTEKLQISSRLNYTNKWSDNLPSAGYGNQSIMYWFIFWQPNADLDWLKNYWRIGEEQRGILYPFSTFPENPYAVSYEFLNKSNRNGFTGNIQAVYNFTDALSLQLRTSMDFGYERRSQQRPYDTSRYPKGMYRTQSIFSQERGGDFLLRYAKQVHPDVNFTVTAGGSTLVNEYNKDETRADALTYPGVYSMANNDIPLTTLPYKSKYVINSFYGLVSAEYRNFLFFDLTARQDWNSVLATPTRTDNVSFFYPSANLSFIASELLTLPDAVNFAKLRLSMSGVGSGGSRPYRTSFNYVSAGSEYAGALVNPGLIPNPDLRPLRTVAYELGTDIRLFKSRLTVDLTAYTGTTKDQHLERVLDRSTGYSSVLINIGEVRNQGLELAVTGSPVKSKEAFNWNMTLTYSANRNKITQLADTGFTIRSGPGGSTIVANLGGSMGDLWGRGFLRSPSGQIVYDESTGFARMTDEFIYLGNTIPKWRAGLNNEFSYRNIRLNVLVDGQYGAVAFSHSHHKLNEQGKLTSTLPGRYNGIIGDGVIQNADGTYRPNDVIAMDIDNYYRSHYNLNHGEGNTFSTDFIKLRELRLDYTLTPRLTQRLRLQRATIGVYGRNLFIWSKWPVFDPEFGTLSGSDIVQGFEVAQFPSTRTYGVNLILGL